MATVPVALKSQSISSWDNAHSKRAIRCIGMIHQLTYNPAAIFDLTNREEPETRASFSALDSPLFFCLQGQ